MDIFYSGTGQNVAVRIELALRVVLRNADTSLFHKVDRFCGPAGTWTVQNSLNSADTARLLAQDCPALLHG